jgi:HAD superfamily hydrolase (TIGR01549 family)
MSNMLESPIILFDMDGTLIDYKKTGKQGISPKNAIYVTAKEKMKQIGVLHGVPIEKLKNLNRLSHIWNKTRTYAEKHGFTEKKIEALMNEINTPFIQIESAEHAISYLIPGTIKTLEAMYNDGYSLGIVTNASRDAYNKISNNPEFGCFGKYFQHIITRDDCNYIKPNPEPLKKTLKLFCRSDFIYIGNSDHDAEATKVAGGIFILLNTNKYSEKKIQEMNVHVVIDKIAELPSIIKRTQSKSIR